jgi:hypothetical protein
VAATGVAAGVELMKNLLSILMLTLSRRTQPPSHPRSQSAEQLAILKQSK